jgi:hypothetical protein
MSTAGSLHAHGCAASQVCRVIIVLLVRAKLVQTLSAMANGATAAHQCARNEVPATQRTYRANQQNPVIDKLQVISAMRMRAAGA